MKLMRVAPVLCSLALLAGSSAWANYRYDVFSAAPACGTVLQSPAIIGEGTCGAVPACGIPHAIDPFAPLWQQAVLDYANTGLRVNDGLVATDLPVQFTQASLARPFAWNTGVLNQAAVVGGSNLFIEAPNAFDTTLLQGGSAQAVQTTAVPAEALPQEQTIIKTTKTTRYVQPRIIKQHRSFLRRCLGRD